MRKTEVSGPPAYIQVSGRIGLSMHGITRAYMRLEYVIFTEMYT